MANPNHHDLNNKMSNTTYDSNSSFFCSMVDVDNFKLLDKKSQSLFILSLNAQGLISKKEGISCLISTLTANFKPPNVICIQETG